jgi:flavin-dependent dehydrogenase
MVINQDIIIIGGGISGSLMALSLIKRRLGLTITIIEKSTKFHKKVGESTSDVTALYFKSEGLHHILEKQLEKTGLRFWFSTKREMDQKLENQNEYSSPSYKGIINGRQFNREILDQDLLDECQKNGVKVIRPATVKKIDYHPFNNLIEINEETENKIIYLSSKWLIDCSGRSRIVSRYLNWGANYTKHNTSSTWAHFTGLKPMKSWDINSHEILDQKTLFPRYHVTGHFMRKGLWWWHIPLKDDTISLGVVYDKNIHTPANARDKFQELIDTDNRIKELTLGAQYPKLYHYDHLPYLPTKLFNQGTLVIGDAAGFIDPLFSPGIEMTCQQIAALTPLLIDYFETQYFNKKKFEKYENQFIKSYQDRLFTYEDKYHVFGSYDLFSCWTQMDLVGYYLFHSIPSAFFSSWIKKPIRLYGPLKIIYNFFKNRFLTIEKNRLKRNEKNPHSIINKPFIFSGARVPKSPKIIFVILELISKWFILYIKIEWHEFIEKVLTRDQQKLLMDAK